MTLFSTLLVVLAFIVGGLGGRKQGYKQGYKYALTELAKATVYARVARIKRECRCVR